MMSKRSNAAKIRVTVGGTVALSLAIALVGGVSESAQASLPSGPTATGVTGARPNASRLSFFVSDEISASVDIGTGNLMVSSRELSLPGVSSRVPLGATYNSLSQSAGSVTTPYANKWAYGLDGAGSLSHVTAGVVYTGGDGSTWLFTPVTGSSTSYNSPAGLKEVLVGSGIGYALTDLTTQQVVSFDTNGSAVSVADRNGNTTTIGFTSAVPTSVVGTAGSLASRTAALTYSSSTLTYTMSQTSGSSSRSVKFVKDSSSNLSSIVDANTKTTSFTYGPAGLSSITSPTGAVINFTYDGSGKISEVDQVDTNSGDPGTATTRLTYPSSTQTLIAGPNTSTSVAVATGPHSTYTIDSNKLVTSATDEMGRVRSKTYTPNFDTATATNGSGSSSGTTTATYGANSGQSLTNLQSPGGSSTQAAYANTAPSTQYEPSSTTDSAGNVSTYTYNGVGNALTSANALAATATLTYNADGTVDTATAPNNGTNHTTYSYNATHQLSSITTPTGSTLGNRAFTYDDFGRLATATDGRGSTISYTYDNVDRLLTTAYSDGTPTVTNKYTSIGQISERDDPYYTLYGYDTLGRLTGRHNTWSSSIYYTYDKASNLLTTSDGRGTTTNSFDASGVVTQMSYPKAGSHQVLMFATDNQGRRTDEWLQANPAHTTWTAHVHTTYDTSGRVTGVVAQTGTGDASNTTVYNQTYCYNSASAAPTCSTNTATDRSTLQWSKDNLSGLTSTYGYDSAARLHTVTQSGTGANTYTYTYDSNGNRLTAVVTGASPSSQTLTTNPGNEISTGGYTFDGAGNMTADPSGTYTYNAAGQMTTVTKAGVTTTYRYAGSGQNEATSESNSSNTSNLVYGRTDAQGDPVVEAFQSVATTYNVGGMTNLTYVENDSVTGQPIMLHTTGDVAALYIYNGTGSPVGLLTDGAATSYIYTFDPYGTPAITSGSTGVGTQQTPFIFKGGIEDRITGWVHYGTRWYNPTTGRFTQQDSLDSPLNPANANRYAYSADDPINLADPHGTDIGDNPYADACLGGVLAGEAIAAVGDVETLGVSAVAGAAIGCAAGAESVYLEQTAQDNLDTDLTDLNYYTTYCAELC